MYYLKIWAVALTIFLVLAGAYTAGALDVLGTSSQRVRHTVYIESDGANPLRCVIDRNDSVNFYNATEAELTIYLPGIGVDAPPKVSWTVAPGEISGGYSWNLDNVNAWFEIDGEPVANIKTTDDPPSGSCNPTFPYRTVIGEVARD